MQPCGRIARIPRINPVNVLTQPAADPTLAEVVWSQLHRYFVTWHNTDEVFPHFPCDVRYDSMAVFEFDAKLSTWQGLNYSSRELNHFLVYSHKYNRCEL